MLFLTFLTFYAFICSAQNDDFSNKRFLKVEFVLNQTILLDSLTVVPESIQFLDLDTSLFNFRLQNNLLEFISSDADLVQDSVLLSFEVMSLNLEKKYQHLDSSLLTTRYGTIYIGHDYSPYQDPSLNKIIPHKGLDYDGSFSRGLSVGNAQSLLLNSNFNLQLSGDLGNDITVRAAISDDNIPIQAEGNTQLLQEFDKVFIEVQRKSNTIIAGDYELRRPNSYFINYFKKLQGLSVINQTSFDENQKLNSRASFAVTRGKFSRITLQTTEGNQGPYKLVGNNGELFVIVLSGSERIYLDGKLLTRGQENDYTISYDRAELIFTPKVLITKDSRIIVEYEYSERNYLRTIYALESDYQLNNLEVNFSFINQQDSKSTTGQIDLSEEDITILRNSGDDPDAAIRTGYNRTEESIETDRILYALRENPDSPLLDSILVYSTDIDSAFYSARFTEVGENNGSYIIDSGAFANGRVYKYVGENMGNYLPIVKLIAPQKNQMMSLGAKYKLPKNISVNGELSLSNNDLNRFSSIDNNDNNGIAGVFGVSQEIKIGKSEKWISKTNANYEIKGKDFVPLNPYREAEFSRNWNLFTNNRSNEQIFSASTGILYNQMLDANYAINSFNRDNYLGIKHLGNVKIKKDGFNFIGILDYLSTSSDLENTKFFKPILEVSQSIKRLNNITVGLNYQRENNRRNSTISNTLLNTSFSFDRFNLFIKNGQEGRLKYQLNFNRRLDHLPSNDDLVLYSTADEFVTNTQWFINESSSLNIDFSYRNLKINDPNLGNEIPRKTYLGRVDYNWQLFKGGVKSLTSYQIQSGQEIKQEFEYVKVNSGEGNYIWIDYNQDSILQQNEFEFSAIDTANYLKVTVFNNEFIRTNSNGINQSLRLEPKFFIEQNRNKGIWGILRKTSTLHTLRINQKTNTDQGTEGFSALKFDIQDTSLVSYNSFLSNNLFFNRSNPKYDGQLGANINQSKIVQITGFESRKLEEYLFRFRFSPITALDFIFNSKAGLKLSDSEIFDERDFSIQFSELNPEINIRPKSNLRFVTKYRYRKKSQQINDLERLNSHDFSFETSYRQASKSSLNLSVSFIRVNFEGSANTPVGFEMLEGLKNGQNYIWNLNYTRRLDNNVDFIINYEGRKTGDSRIVHIGRAQVKASF